MFKFFQKSKALIAEIILFVMLLPAVCYIISLIVGQNNMTDVLINFLDTLPITEHWVSVLYVLIDSPSKTLEFICNDSTQYLKDGIFEAFIIGTCMCLVKNIWQFFKLPEGHDFFLGIVGIFLSCIFVTTCKISLDITSYLYCTGLILVNMVLIMIQDSKTNIIIRYFKACAEISIQIFMALLLSCYVIFLALLSQGFITDLSTVIIFVISITIPLIGFAIINYVFFSKS